MQLKYVSRVALNRAPQIIIACAVLHNIRKQRHQIKIDDAPESDDEEEDEEVGVETDRRHQLDEEAVDAMHRRHRQTGNIFRNRIVQNYFNA
jgi:hypothetical protein